MGCVASRPANGTSASAGSFQATPATNKRSESTQGSGGRAKPSIDDNARNAAESSLLALAMDASAGGAQTSELVQAGDKGTTPSEAAGPTPSTVMLRAKQPFENDNDHQLDEVTSNSILADVAYSMLDQSKSSSAVTAPLAHLPAVKKTQTLAVGQSNATFLTPIVSQQIGGSSTRQQNENAMPLTGQATVAGIPRNDLLASPLDPIVGARREIPFPGYELPPRGRGVGVGRGQPPAGMPAFHGPAGLVPDGMAGRGFPVAFAGGGRGHPLRVMIPPINQPGGSFARQGIPNTHEQSASTSVSSPRGVDKHKESNGSDNGDDDDDDDDLVDADDEVGDWDLEDEADTNQAVTGVSKASAKFPRLEQRETAVGVSDASSDSNKTLKLLSHAPPTSLPADPSPPKTNPPPAHPARGKFRPAFEMPNEFQTVESDGDGDGSSDSDIEDDNSDASSGEAVHDWLDNDAPPSELQPNAQPKGNTSLKSSRSVSADRMNAPASPLAKPASAQALPNGQRTPTTVLKQAPHPGGLIPAGFVAFGGPQPPSHLPPGAQVRLSPTRSPMAAGMAVTPGGPVSSMKQPSYRSSIMSNVSPGVVPMTMMAGGGGAGASPVKATTPIAASPPSPTPGSGQAAAIRDTKVVKKKKAELPQHNLPHPVPKFGDWLNSRTMINNYIILETLGAGSYAEVKLCKEKLSGKLFAMKFISCDIMKKDKLGKQSKLDDIKREIAIMKKLHHPNVLLLYEVMDDPKMNKLFLVLEYMKNGDLLSHQKKKHPHGALESSHDRDLHCIFLQVILGLAYLHEQKIVHGDIKPQNLLVSDKDVVKIADFGISQSLYGSKQKILDTAGTPAFMSPEMCSGEEYSGQLADIWAVGATFFMLKFGQPPFVAKSAMQIFDKIQNDPLVFPAPIDPSLQHLLTGMLTKNPEERMTLLDVMTHPWVTMDEGPALSVSSPVHLMPTPLISVSKEEIDHAVGGQDRFALVVNTRAQMMKRLHQARLEVLERHRRQQQATQSVPASSSTSADRSGAAGALDMHAVATEAQLRQRSTPTKSVARPKGNRILATTSDAAQPLLGGEPERQVLTSEEIEYCAQLFLRKKPSNSKNTVELPRGKAEPGASELAAGYNSHRDHSIESDVDEDFSSDDDDVAVSQSPQLLDELLLTTLSMPPLTLHSGAKAHDTHSHSGHGHSLSNSSSLVMAASFSNSSDEQAYRGENRTLGLQYGVASLQGRRNTQEDRWVVLPAIDSQTPCTLEGAAYVGLYDGHGGEECANILHDQLHSWIFKGIDDDGDHLEEVLESCYLELDSFVCDYLLQKGDLSGSTATSIVLTRRRTSDTDGHPRIRMSVAHVGDCRLVLVRRTGEVVAITKDHRLELAAERERILQLGGRVVNNRVNGVMAITRAFGDLEFKGLLDRRGNGLSASSIGVTPSLQQQQNPFAKEEEKTPALLTAHPDIHALELDPVVDECLVLACDGLWDVMTSEEAAEIVRERVRLHGNVQLAAKELAQEAIRRYSNDNITVIVVTLNAP